MDLVTVDIFDFIYFGGKGKGKARATGIELPDFITQFSRSPDRIAFLGIGPND
jgi:hypothetical protein